jgi:hypothetical protein
VQPNTFRTLAEYIHELRRRNRDYYGPGEHPAFDTTIEDDHNWDQGNSSGNAGRGENTQR